MTLLPNMPVSSLTRTRTMWRKRARHRPGNTMDAYFTCSTKFQNRVVTTTALHNTTLVGSFHRGRR
jgi:hypothetical protein